MTKERYLKGSQGVKPKLFWRKANKDIELRFLNILFRIQ